MYYNSGTEITNTPTAIVAGHNTWPYSAPRSAWYQKTPYYYTGVDGKIYRWDSWNQPRIVQIPGGMWKGTPTRTGGFYAQNTIIMQ